MQQGPNMDDIQKYSDEGYIQVLNILANYMLKKKDPNSYSYINYGFAVQKYDEYRFNEFASYAGASPPVAAIFDSPSNSQMILVITS